MLSNQPLTLRYINVCVVCNEQPGSHLRPASRHIKSSPALFSLERVMQSFRARSQLLVSRLEDSDDVLHQTFSDENLPQSLVQSTYVHRVIHFSFVNYRTISGIYLFLALNSRSVFRAGVSLNIHSFIHSIIFFSC